MGVARVSAGPDCGEPFDRRAWSTARAQADPGPEGSRLRRLARRLVECDELLDSSEADLRALLGRPTYASTDTNPRPHREAAWRVGINEQPSDDEDVLFVEFDRGGVVYAETPRDVDDGGGEPVTSGGPVGGGAVAE